MRYAFSDEFTDDELPWVGGLVVRGQLSVYRAIAKSGALVHVASGLGDRELSGFRDGTAALFAELTKPTGRLPVAPSDNLELDTWLLRHLAIFSSMTMRSALTGLLPTSFSMLETRAKRLQPLL